MTKLKISFAQYRRIFFHPRVLMFLLAGTVIIFLTFLTENNAMEIAISGIASVFIGIGVNNFSSFETRLKDEARFKPEISFCIKVMEMTAAKIGRVNAEMGEGDAHIKNELNDLQQFIRLNVQHIKEGDLQD